MPKHVLYRTGDKDCPTQICDRNGEVVLAECRHCRKAESELDLNGECFPAFVHDPKRLTFADVGMITQAVGGPIAAMVFGLPQIDLAAGRGKIGDSWCCVWLKDGRRITVELLSHGGVVGYISGGPDPGYPGHSQKATDKAVRAE